MLLHDGNLQHLWRTGWFEERGGKMRDFWRDETGTTSVEYALLLSVVVIATLAGWSALGEAVEHSVSASIDTISNGPSPAGVP